MIVKANQDYQNHLQAIKEQQEKEKKSESSLSDPRLQKAYQAIEDILNQIEQVQAI